MTHFVQETNSRTVYSLSLEFPLPFPGQVPNETFGGQSSVNFLPVSLGSGVLRRAWEFTHDLDDEVVKEQATKLLSAIQEILSLIQEIQPDLSHIPPLRSFVVDDGSILFEWIFNDYRIGFGIEPDPDESSWYLVTNQKLGSISAAGYMSADDLPRLVTWLLGFVISHS